jgi:hypothetical protein
MDSATIFAFGLVGLILGGTLAVIFTAMWAWSAGRRARAKRFVSTSGVLQELTITKRRLSYGVTEWRLRARYEYAVDGVKMSGRRVGLDFNSFPREALAKKASEGLAAGQAVTVWYDPRSPKVAVLSRAEPIHFGLYRTLAVVAAVFAVAGGIAVVLNASAALTPPPTPVANAAAAVAAAFGLATPGWLG